MTTLHTGVSPRLRAPKRAVALLLLPLALLLSACHIDSVVTVDAAGGVDVDINVTGNKDALDLSSLSCEDYMAYLRDLDPVKFKTPQETQDGSGVLCNYSGHADNALNGVVLVDNGSTYTLNIPIQTFLHAYPEKDSRDTYRIVVHMPGEIVSASEGGTVKGSDVIYEGKLADLNGDIRIEAKKSKGSTSAVWVLVVLAVLLGLALLFSRYLRKKHSPSDEDSSKWFGKKTAKDDEDSEGDDSISASTTDSTVALAPLPERYMPSSSGSTSESYSEQIDMVDPVAQGSGADVVKRETVMLALPSETDKVLPIPGMPPRLPMLGDVDDAVDGDQLFMDEEDEDSLADNEAAAFFSQFLDVTDDEDVEEETDL